MSVTQPEFRPTSFVGHTPGCSSDDLGAAKFSTVPAKGKVTVAGKPVTKGIIVFEPTVDGGSTQQASGEIKSDGTFELRSGGDRQGAMPGKYRVKVESDEAKPKAPSKAAAPVIIEVKEGQELLVDLP